MPGAATDTNAVDAHDHDSQVEGQVQGARSTACKLQIAGKGIGSGLGDAPRRRSEGMMRFWQVVVSFQLLSNIALTC